MNTTKHRLTRRQEQILEAIRSSLRDRGFPPSIREIGEAVGLSSSSTVHSHLRTLERHRYIRRDPAKPRSLQLVDQDPGRVERLEALVREARKWTACGLITGEEQAQWLQAANALLEPASA